jgi:ABC-2 type transport system ATP-binding protein
MQASSVPGDVLIAEDVTRRNRDGRGIHDVSLRLGAGEVLGLLGGDRGGKTALLRVLAALDPPDGGRVRWFGVDDRGRADVRARIGVALDAPVHYASLTGWQNASYVAALHGVPRAVRDGRLSELFRWAGIDGARDLRVRQYTPWMRRRLTLVEALAHTPDLLIIDEPTLALDEDGKLHLTKRLQWLAAEGVSAVIATSDRNAARRLCHRCLELPDVREARREPASASGVAAS